MRTALTLIALAAGCTDDRADASLASLDLRAAMQTTSDLRPIGLAITPDGQRFVFEESSGLFRIDGDRMVPVVAMASMPSPGVGVALQLPFTDLVAIAPHLFALTAIGDGFLLDTEAMTLRQHFCYLPDGLPTGLTQRTDGIAYDAAKNKLYAQPLTYDAAGALQFAQIASYDRATGDDVDWYNADAGVAATGMIAIPDVGLVLGQGSNLSRFDLATSQALPLDDLARFGVSSIDGLAIDAAAGTLVVVDKDADAVFEIELSRIAL